MESNMQKLAGLLKREGIPFEINYQKRFDKAPQICCPSTRVVRYGGGGCTVISGTIWMRAARSCGIFNGA